VPKLRIIFREILSRVESQSFPAPFSYYSDDVLAPQVAAPTGPPHRTTLDLNTIWRHKDAIFMPDIEDNQTQAYWNILTNKYDASKRYQRQT
jgi:hypothetical protein